MTIEQEEIGSWFAVCDRCGDRIELDAEDMASAVEELFLEHNWQHKAPERVRFKTPLPYTEEYGRDLCEDCQSEEPAPTPLMRSKPAATRIARDPFDNDPCDEWPRALIWQAVGLSSCGHPKGPVPCRYCDHERLTGRGYGSAIGR